MTIDKQFFCVARIYYLTANQDGEYTSILQGIPKYILTISVLTSAQPSCCYVLCLENIVIGIIKQL